MKHLKRFENFYLQSDNEEINKDQESEDLKSLFAGRNPDDDGRESEIDYTKTAGDPDSKLRDVVAGRMPEDEEEEELTPYAWEDECSECNCKPCRCDEVVERKKVKPDFLDLDRDGDKKESMRKAAKEAKEKTHKKGVGGLTAAQKKLPAGLQKAILAKKNK